MPLKKSTSILRNGDQIDGLTVRNCQELYTAFYIFFKSQEKYQIIIYKADDFILIWCLGKKNNLGLLGFFLILQVTLAGCSGKIF